MRNSKGFTLIELLVVLAILFMLGTLTVVAVNGSRQGAWCAKKGIKNVENCESAYAEHLNSNKVNDYDSY